MNGEVAEGYEPAQMTDVVFLSQITPEHFKQLLAKSIRGGHVEAVDRSRLPGAVWHKLNFTVAQTPPAFANAFGTLWNWLERQQRAQTDQLACRTDVQDGS